MVQQQQLLPCGFFQKIAKKPALWSLDRLVIAVALAAGFVRIGNLMNSEIVEQRLTMKVGLFMNLKLKVKFQVFNIDKEKIKFDKTNSDTLIGNIYFPKIKVSIP